MSAKTFHRKYTEADKEVGNPPMEGGQGIVRVHHGLGKRWPCVTLWLRTGSGNDTSNVELPGTNLSITNTDDLNEFLVNVQAYSPMASGPFELDVRVVG